MKRIRIWIFLGLLLLLGDMTFSNQGGGAEKKGGYVLLGDVKEGWKVFTMKKCGSCHAIWGEGGKGGPDLGTLPESYVSPSQLAALMWNHWPEMWGRMSAKKIPVQKMKENEMADLFAFLYFIRYMDEPGDPGKGKIVMEAKSCGKCHTVKEGTKEDLGRWGRYTNPILWTQMMWSHAPQMEQEMNKKGIPWVEFKGNEMVNLIAYIRSISPKAEKVYLSPGDPQSGAKWFTQKGCVQCHGPKSPLDLSKKNDFARTLGQLAGMLWNHSPEMWKGMEEKRLPRPPLSSQEMADIIAYLFSTRYFDDPGDPERGRMAFAKKQCNLCHTRGGKTLSLSNLKGQISPIFMAQTMWNHGPEMLERMRKAKVSWQKVDGNEMVNLMAYLNQGVP